VPIKLPPALDKKAHAASRKRGESLSLLTRRAIERETTDGGPDFATLAARYQGMMRGPKNLSSREGYGG